MRLAALLGADECWRRAPRLLHKLCRRFFWSRRRSWFRRRRPGGGSCSRNGSGRCCNACPRLSCRGPRGAVPRRGPSRGRRCLLWTAAGLSWKDAGRYRRISCDTASGSTPPPRPKELSPPLARAVADTAAGGPQRSPRPPTTPPAADKAGGPSGSANKTTPKTARTSEQAHTALRVARSLRGQCADSWQWRPPTATAAHHWMDENKSLVFGVPAFCVWRKLVSRVLCSGWRV